MKLIVGLGNPGKEYEKTRHNVGYILIDNYLKNINYETNKEKFSGKYIDLLINGEKVIFLKPETYMNLSGECIIKFIKYFNINLDNILIICDDVNLEIGKIRLRKKGTSGGHNGINNIIKMLGTDDFKRLKIGISKDEKIELSNYVLGKFSDEEYKIINDKKIIINELINDYLSMDFELLMAKYN